MNMDRFTLTPEQQTFVEGYRVQYNVTPSDEVVVGTTLKVDDHLQIDNAWKCVAVRGDGNGAVDIYVPEWGIDLIFPCDLVNYISDRAGPNGEEMPIRDEEQMAMLAKQGGMAPKYAVTEERERHRGVKEALKASLKRISKDDAHRLREAMRNAGVLGRNET